MGDSIDQNFTCTYCRFSIRKLQEMAEMGGTAEVFTTFAGQSALNIYEVNVRHDYITMRRRSTERFTPRLRISRLIDIHDRVHSGQILLDPYEIDEEMRRWGNYVAALLKHLGCSKIT
jgi:hypothetical protein